VPVVAGVFSYWDGVPYRHPFADEGLCKAGCFVLLDAWLNRMLDPMRADIRRKAKAEDKAEEERLRRRLERARQQGVVPLRQ